MFRYVLVLLLINAYSRSLGVPIKENASNISLSTSLTILAQRCENPVLSALITSKIVECDVIAPPYAQKQLECLMFIDINTQLCDAVTTSKLSVSDELKAKINESVEVDKFCTIASKWNITNLPGFPLYKHTAETVFDNAIACTRVCGVEDIMSEDTNFYCKYYKWGMELLNQQPSTATQTSNNPVISGSAEKSDDIRILPDSSNTVNSADALKNSQSSKETLKEPTEVKPAFDVEELPPKPESTSLLSSTKDLQIIPDNVEEKNIASNTEAKVFKPEAAIAPSNSGPSNEAIDKPSAAEIQPIKPEDAGKIEKPIRANAKDAVIDKAKSQASQDPDDYPDTEEVNEGLPDLKGGDDRDDPMLGDLDTKQELDQTKAGAKKIDSPLTSINGEREAFANTMQESFTDDDDHFFPFFLTAVILVVLLYVLYHNKNKVSKVFLGLIVEGRQPGRRRNSRGHAYRRLDTLEQAMSANTAAPPSKIIY